MRLSWSVVRDDSTHNSYVGVGCGSISEDRFDPKSSARITSSSSSSLKAKRGMSMGTHMRHGSWIMEHNKHACFALFVFCWLDFWLSFRVCGLSSLAQECYVHRPYGGIFCGTDVGTKTNEDFLATIVNHRIFLRSAEVRRQEESLIIFIVLLQSIYIKHSFLILLISRVLCLLLSVLSHQETFFVEQHLLNVLLLRLVSHQAMLK